MNQLFKKIYVVALAEILLLIVILLWNPSEEASQFFLGRSVLRWILTLPAIILLVAGSAISLIKPLQEKLIRFCVKALKDLNYSLNGKGGDYITFFGSLFLIFLGTGIWIVEKEGFLDAFIRGIPWVILSSIFFLQFVYLAIRAGEDSGGKLNFRGSFARIPTTLRDVLLNENDRKPIINKKVNICLYWISITTLFLVFLFVGYFFINYAGLNSDEGWYLYAARQVYQGDRPYQGFAFTQMPLLPYVYGVGQLLYPSMYTGRIMSLVIFGAAISLAMIMSRKHFGQEASIWLLILVITNATGFYFNTIVKTYSLTLFFFLLSLFIWMSNLKPGIKYPWLAFVLCLGCLTRQTFVIYALIIQMAAIVEIWKLKDRVKIFWNILILNAPLVIWGLSFFYPNPRNFYWDIFTYNAGIHGLSASQLTPLKFLKHGRSFLGNAEEFWPIGIPFMLSILSSIYYRNINNKYNQKLLIAFIGTLCFVSIHFIGTLPMGEYYVPPIMFIVILIIFFLFSFSEHKSNLNKLILWSTRITLAFITITLINTGKFGQYNYDYYNGHPPIQTVRDIAEVANQYFPDTPLFTLEGLYVAIDGQRDIVPGLSMAQFSILDMSSEKVTELHFVNAEIVSEILKSPSTKVLLLTELEISSLQSSIDGFDDILGKNYANVYQADNFGQKSVKAYVFVRK